MNEERERCSMGPKMKPYTLDPLVVYIDAVPPSSISL
jgi:hypothetical protein